MKIYYTEITDRSGSDTVRALLRRALWLEYGMAMPEILKSPGGKPYFAGGNIHFSLSHTKTHVMAAVASSPCGCDIETVRPVNPAVIRRMLTEREQAELYRDDDFFKYWCLKESLYKLLDGTDMRRAEFHILGDRAVYFGNPELKFFVYTDIDGTAAACCGAEDAGAPVHIDPEDLIY